MYLHVLIETDEKIPKTDSYRQHFELDKSAIDMVEREVIEPFLRGQKFQFDGYFMSSADIKRIVVKSTERTTSQLSDDENSIIKPRGLISSTSRQDIFWMDRYAKDITKEVFASVQTRVLTEETNSIDPKTGVLRPTTVERKITEVINKLNEFMGHLHRLVEKADHDEDWQIGDAQLRRWKKRVVTYLKEEVSEEEVNDFDQIELRGTTERGAGGYLYEAFQPLYAALEALAERIEDNPVEVLQTGPTETTSLPDQGEVLIIFDVFLSYASTDQLEADQLYEAIGNAGGKVFLAGKSLRPGDDFAEEIRNALWSSREVWLLVSPNSLKSDWVISEWGAAWALRKRIVPILFRCAPGEAPDRIRRLHCIDFHKYPELIKDKFRTKKSVPAAKSKGLRKDITEPTTLGMRSLEAKPACPNCSTTERPFLLSPIPSDFVEIENATHECSRCKFKTKV